MPCPPEQGMSQMEHIPLGDSGDGTGLGPGDMALHRTEHHPRFPV